MLLWSWGEDWRDEEEGEEHTPVAHNGVFEFEFDSALDVGREMLEGERDLWKGYASVCGGRHARFGARRDGHS